MFTFGERAFTFGERTFTSGIIRVFGFFGISFCCWGVLGLRGSGGPVGFSKISKISALQYCTGIFFGSDLVDNWDPCGVLWVCQCASHYPLVSPQLLCSMSKNHPIVGHHLHHQVAVTSEVLCLWRRFGFFYSQGYVIHSTKLKGAQTMKCKLWTETLESSRLKVPNSRFALHGLAPP